MIEDRLVGEEVSFYAVTDGETITSLAAAQDHKRALDGDRGENTGGMGACSPPPGFAASTEKRVIEEIVHPTVRGMAAEGCPYTGVLYVGLMIAPDGAPRVVEYNARFGDPETQPLVLRMEGDLVGLLEGAAHGRLGGAAPLGWSDAAVCVVLASGGYPRDFRSGLPIEGLEAAERDPQVVVFHAGTRRDAAGRFVTAGGRVLGVTARAATLAEARRARLRRRGSDPIRGHALPARHRVARGGLVIPDPLGDAARWLRSGGLLAYPTETVWGLGADATSDAAVARLLRWKGRDDERPARDPGRAGGGPAAARLRARPRRPSGWPRSSGPGRSRWCSPAAGASRRASRGRTAPWACAAPRIRWRRRSRAACAPIAWARSPRPA